MMMTPPLPSKREYTRDELLAAGYVIDTDGNAVDPNDDQFYEGEDLGEGEL